MKRLLPPNIGTIKAPSHPPMAMAGAKLVNRRGRTRYYATSMGKNATQINQPNCGAGRQA